MTVTRSRCESVVCVCVCVRSKGSSRPRYEVRNRLLHVLFLLSAAMGHEMFYITCLPNIHWNLDPFLCRRLINMWTVSLPGRRSDPGGGRGGGVSVNVRRPPPQGPELRQWPPFCLPRLLAVTFQPPFILLPATPSTDLSMTLRRPWTPGPEGPLESTL